MWADFFTKPLHGSQFRLLRALIMNPPMTPELAHLMKLSHPKAIRESNYLSSAPLQECVEADAQDLAEDPSQPAMESREPMRARSYADVAAGTTNPRQTRGSQHQESELTSLDESS